MNTKRRTPRVLAFDLESAPGTCYYWQLKQDGRIPLDFVITTTRIICASWAWLGTRKIHSAAEWSKGGRRKMLKSLAAAITQADLIVTYNGKSYDVPRVSGELVAANLPPLPNVAHCDLYQHAKKLGYDSGKMQHVAAKLGIGQKEATGGFNLWRRIEQGDKQARRQMLVYNRGDVRLTVDMFQRLRPLIRTLPALYPPGACQACGGTMHADDFRYTAKAKIERLACESCGAWSDGTRTPQKRTPAKGAGVVRTRKRKS